MYMVDVQEISMRNTLIQKIIMLFIFGISACHIAYSDDNRHDVARNTIAVRPTHLEASYLRELLEKVSRFDGIIEEGYTGFSDEDVILLKFPHNDLYEVLFAQVKQYHPDIGVAEESTLDKINKILLLPDLYTILYGIDADIGISSQPSCVVQLFNKYLVASRYPDLVPVQPFYEMYLDNTKQLLATPVSCMKREDVARAQCYVIGDIHGAIAPLLHLMRKVNIAQEVMLEKNEAMTVQAYDGVGIENVLEDKYLRLISGAFFSKMTQEKYGITDDTYVLEVSLEVPRYFIWTGEDKILISMGDVLSGTEESLCFELLRGLQYLATKHNGKVIRLIGNHDFERVTIGASKFSGTVWSRVSRMPQEAQAVRLHLIQDIADGRVHAAYTLHDIAQNIDSDDWIFVHGEIARDYAKQFTGVHAMADDLNGQLTELGRAMQRSLRDSINDPALWQAIIELFEKYNANIANFSIGDLVIMLTDVCEYLRFEHEKKYFANRVLFDVDQAFVQYFGMTQESLEVIKHFLLKEVPSNMRSLDSAYGPNALFIAESSVLNAKIHEDNPLLNNGARIRRIVGHSVVPYIHFRENNVIPVDVNLRMEQHMDDLLAIRLVNQEEERDTKNDRESLRNNVQSLVEELADIRKVSIDSVDDVEHYDIVIALAQHIVQLYQTQWRGHKLIFVGGACKRVWRAVTFLCENRGMPIDDIVYLDFPRYIARYADSTMLHDYLDVQGVFGENKGITIIDNMSDTGATIDKIEQVIRKHSDTVSLSYYMMYDNGSESFSSDIPAKHDAINKAAIFLGSSNWMDTDKRSTFLVRYVRQNDAIVPVYLSIDQLQKFLHNITRGVDFNDLNVPDMSDEDIFNIKIFARMIAPDAYIYKNWDAVYDAFLEKCSAHKLSEIKIQDNIFKLLLEYSVIQDETLENDSAAVYMSA